jgi:GRIP domain
MEKKTVSPSSPLGSRVSLTEPHSPSVHAPLVETPRQSISTANGTDSVKAAIDKEYLKNVLVQFFEHKDKRVWVSLKNALLTLLGPITSGIVNVA